MRRRRKVDYQFFEMINVYFKIINPNNKKENSWKTSIFLVLNSV